MKEVRGCRCNPTLYLRKNFSMTDGLTVMRTWCDVFFAGLTSVRNMKCHSLSGEL
jgi:hypothetical protein